MLIAILSKTSTYNSVVPEVFEEANNLWIMESNGENAGMYPQSVYTKTPDTPDLFQKAMLAYHIDTIVCGSIQDTEPSSIASIKHFNGAGLTVEEAVRAVASA